jgi:alkanesulfonate monooxygenase SsuD/methylene tetrahydromethanopterin reductase-like flavin-dependent oxidoreductase (luciferase family)
MAAVELAVIHQRRHIRGVSNPRRATWLLSRGECWMKFGFFFQLPCAPWQSERERYGDTLAQIKHGDALGFDTAWLAELHFFPEFSVMSSPLIVAAAAAQQTQRIRLGMAVSLLPLNDPLRSAEDAATVDLLSDGRLVFGVGRGTNPLHYGGFNIPMEESRGRFTEALEIVTQAWTSERVNYEGKYYRIKDVAVYPKPLQKPHPPIRIATNSSDTFPLAGQLGYPMFSSLVVVPLPRFRRDIAVYWQTFEEAGHRRSGDEVALLFPLYVAATEAEAQTVPRQSIMHYFEVLGRRMVAGDADMDAATRERNQEMQARLQRLTFDEVRENVAIIGTPEHCIERIRWLRNEFHLSELICWFNPGGLMPQQTVLTSMSRFATQVIPSLR